LNGPVDALIFRPEMSVVVVLKCLNVVKEGSLAKQTPVV
jgi:hypothetical protein